MGIFSKTCQYAIRAIFYIAKRSEQGYKSNVKEIALAINSPEHFLAKILQQLSKEGLVQSIKGPNGGFHLDAVQLKRPIMDIIITIEGDDLFVGCGMGLSNCSEINPCPLHKDFKQIRCKLIKIFKTTTIGQFNEELINGELTLHK